MPHYRQHDLEATDHENVQVEDLQDGDILVFRSDLGLYSRYFDSFIDIDLPPRGDDNFINGAYTKAGYVEDRLPGIPEQQTGMPPPFDDELMSTWQPARAINGLQIKGYDTLEEQPEGTEGWWVNEPLADQTTAGTTTTNTGRAWSVAVGG